MRTRSQWADPPKPGDEIACIFGGRPIKCHVTVVDVEAIFVRGLGDSDAEAMLFFVREEGTKWARGWDSETAGALSAAYALSAP